MALSGSEQNAAALEGLAEISPMVARYAKIEDIYLEQQRKHKDTTKLKTQFKTRLIDLYAKILEYQVSMACHCKRSKLGEIQIPYVSTLSLCV